jgi:vitamin B12 transporter
VVVTATRIETPSAQVASSVTVMTAEEIERRQYRLVTDALRHVPGVDVRRNGGPGTNTSLFIRGADSDHVLVLLDGVEMNDPSSPSRVPFLNHLTTEDIERIEVVRGPQSSLYGGDAMSGVVQIFTKRGDGDLSVSGMAEGGSYSSARATVSLSGSTDRLDYAVAGSHWSSDGYSASSAGSERDPYRNTTASGRFGWMWNERLAVDGMVRFSDAKVEFDGFSVEEDHHTDAEQLLARIAPRVRLFDGRWQQTLAVQYSRHERDTASTFPSKVDGTLYAVDWQNDLRLFSEQVVTMGIEGEWEEAEFSTFDDSRRTLGLYLQDRFTWGERLFGTLGVRFDDPSDFDSRVTYRFTAGTRIPEIHTVVRSSYGTGFKAPSLSQLNPLAFGGNADLDPERSKGFDFEIEPALWDGKFVGSATFFYNVIDDLIVAVFDPVTSSFLNFNVDRATALGVEATFSIEPISNLRVIGSYTFTRTKATGTPAGFGLEEGSRLLRRPDHKATFDVVWQFLGGRGELSTSVLYVGRRRDLDPNTFAAVTADDYTTVNVAARFNVTDWLEVYVRIDNVFDEDYEEVLGFSTAGLSAYGGIRLRY